MTGFLGWSVIVVVSLLWLLTIYSGGVDLLEWYMRTRRGMLQHDDPRKPGFPLKSMIFSVVVTAVFLIFWGVVILMHIS